tara:strand:- start:520 stop:1512 length:993 start_codon:yes stop_codon:yes gene_type:complete
MSNSKYPNFKILQENDFDFSKLKISEIGERNDLIQLDEWLQSEEYNNARSQKIISYIDEGNPIVFYPLGTNKKENHKEFHKIKKCKEDSPLLDEILKPQLERVIFLKFFAEVINEIELMKNEKKVTEIINNGFNQTVNSIKRFANNSEYLLSLDCDPYFSEKIIWRDIVNKLCKKFFTWKFSDYLGPEKEDEISIKSFNKSFERISKPNFIKKRKAFRRLAMQRTETLLNEIRKFGNLSDKSHYQYTQQEIKEIWVHLTKMINQAFRGFRPIGLENPYQIRSEETTFQQQIKNPKGNVLEIELESLKKSMHEKFRELELKINLSEEDKKE